MKKFTITHSDLHAELTRNPISGKEYIQKLQGMFSSGTVIVITEIKGDKPIEEIKTQPEFDVWFKLKD